MNSYVHVVDNIVLFLIKMYMVKILSTKLISIFVIKRSTLNSSIWIHLFITAYKTIFIYNDSISIGNPNSWLFSKACLNNVKKSSPSLVTK